MSNVAKNLSDLDALADAVLSKSIKDDKEELKPEEISENIPENDKPAADTPEVNDAEDEAKDLKESDEEENEEDLEKCGNSDVKKSEEPESVSEDEPEEDLEKSNPDEGEVEEVDNEDEDDESKEDLEKSIKSDFTSNAEIANGMDASEFLSSVVEILSKSLANTAGEIYTSRVSNEQGISVLAKSLQAALNLNKSMAEEMTSIKKENEELKKSIVDGFADIKASLEEVLSQPVGMRKSVKNIQVMDRNFQKSLNGDTAGTESLSKSQVMDILMSEMHAGNQAVTAGDIVAFESGAPLHAGLVALVNSKCR